MKTIQELMKEMTNLPYLPVYRVTLSCDGHSDMWVAWADLRGDDRNYSSGRKSPEEALTELKNVLEATICPHCHQRISDNRRNGLVSKED